MATKKYIKGITSEIASQTYDVIIIGSGMAGLVCGANLAYNGLKVLIIEQHFQIGGATSTFRRKNFTFEAGGHRVSGVFAPNSPIKSLLDRIKKNVVFLPLDPVYTVLLNDYKIIAHKNFQQYKKELFSNFPAEKESIENFFRTLLEFLEGFDYVSSVRIPNPIKLKRKFSAFIKYKSASLYQFLIDHVENADLRQILSVLGLFTGIPDTEQSFFNFALMWRVHHFGEGMSSIEGGTTALTQALADYIMATGGEIVLSTKVESIIVKNKKALGIRTKGNHSIYGKYTVSTTSTVQTYLKFINPTILPKKLVNKIRNQKASGSVFQVYIGLKSSEEEFSSRTTFFLGKNVGLSSSQDYYNKANNWDLDTITQCGVLSVEVPNHTPKGFRGINITIALPYKHPNNWYLLNNSEDKKINFLGHMKRNIKYHELKQEISSKIIENFSQIIPNLKERIVVLETATPLTIERYTSATEGGLQGLAQNIFQTGKNRGDIKTVIPNLYHCGQYTFPSAGIYGVSQSGTICAKMIIDKERK